MEPPRIWGDMSPSHLHLEMEVGTRHVLPVVLVKRLILGHHEVVLPDPEIPGGEKASGG